MNLYYGISAYLLSKIATTIPKLKRTLTSEAETGLGTEKGHIDETTVDT